MTLFERIYKQQRTRMDHFAASSFSFFQIAHRKELCYSNIEWCPGSWSPDPVARLCMKCPNANLDDRYCTANRFGTTAREYCTCRYLLARPSSCSRKLPLPHYLRKDLPHTCAMALRKIQRSCCLSVAKSVLDVNLHIPIPEQGPRTSYQRRVCIGLPELPL